jgi:hypothetical protein
MLTIAGGILLAILVILTIPLWLPLLGWLLVFAIGIAVIALIASFPEEFLVVGAFIAVIFVAGFISAFFNRRSEERGNKKSDLFLPKKEEENLSSPLGEIKDEFGTPECLAARKDKNQMIDLANKFGITVSESDSRTCIARKIFGVKSEVINPATEIAESDSITSKYHKTFDIKNESTVEVIKNKINPEDDKSETGDEKTSILEKIDQVREKEITRLKDEKKKAEEAKRKEDKLLAEKFLIIKKTLQELQITYAKDEDIDIAVSKLSACLTLGKYSDYSKREISISPSRYDDGFLVTDSHDDDYKNYNCSEKVIDNIVERVGKFLAERDSG